MPFKPNEREYRALTLVPQKENRFDSECYVEGHATTFEPYELYEFEGVKYFERIDRHAFDEADMGDIIFQYNHQGRVLARQSNNTLHVEPNDAGLFICADLSKTDEARKMFEDITTGMVTKMSWAFNVVEDSYDRDTRTRTILKVGKVYDVSAVSIPANDGTDISARSFFDGEIEKEKQELQEREQKQAALELERAKVMLKTKIL